MMIGIIGCTIYKVIEKMRIRATDYESEALVNLRVYEKMLDFGA